MLIIFMMKFPPMGFQKCPGGETVGVVAQDLHESSFVYISVSASSRPILSTKTRHEPTTMVSAHWSYCRIFSIDLCYKDKTTFIRSCFPVVGAAFLDKLE